MLEDDTPVLVLAPSAGSNHIPYRGDGVRWLVGGPWFPHIENAVDQPLRLTPAEGPLLQNGKGADGRANESKHSANTRNVAPCGDIADHVAAGHDVALPERILRHVPDIFAIFKKVLQQLLQAMWRRSRMPKTWPHPRAGFALCEAVQV